MKLILLFIIINFSLLASSLLDTNITTKAESTRRYFGGLSEIETNTPNSIMLTPSTLMTEEVFSAKDTKELEMAVVKQKKEQVKNGEQVQEFAMERSGHLYGGLSQVSLNFK